MSSLPIKHPTLQMIDGVLRSPLSKPDVYRKATSFKPAANDLILMTHPKSGTHWVAQIVLLILDKGRPPKDLAEFVRKAPFLELNGAPASGQMPRFLCTHLPFGQLPFEKDAKYIYVARNPYDTCVSFYHHVKRLPWYRFGNCCFGDFVDAFVSARVGQADQLDHVLSGYARRHEPNVLFLTYEELKADTPSAVLKLAKFLGGRCATMFDQDNGLMDDIVFKSSAGYMKERYDEDLEELRVIYNICPLPREIEADVEARESEHRYSIVRKGVAGNWAPHFSPDSLERMQAWIDIKTRGSDVMSLWEQQTKPGCNQLD